MIAFLKEKIHCYTFLICIIHFYTSLVLIVNVNKTQDILQFCIVEGKTVMYFDKNFPNFRKNLT